MICKIVQKIGLYIFWQCLDDKSREKSILEHRYTKMNTDHIDNIIKKVEKYEEKYKHIKNKVLEVNSFIENNDNLEEIKKYLKSLIKEVKDV
ncbi:hypothetical protein ACOTWR_06280 [Aliarcobacter butzleri]|uniref:hypothetical protein n=1 Tax=Aliarcobacter butzleri TaxID=28197 RepID=UPI0021B263CF|nr:hypothetical protein [Aliarcobacter butzleri]MCT7578658.1 hypothetical protein [Aliarcobacter butzleri]MCT7647600.1 hypothetical protein [Aliarcobacter butzleri]